MLTAISLLAEIILKWPDQSYKT